MDDINRIEVIRGPGGTIWGPNAVNGVSNIITKNPKDTQGLLASVRTGNEEQGVATVRYGGSAFGDRLNYRVYAKGFTRSPEHHLDGSNFDDWRAAQSGFRMDWKRSERDTINVQGHIYKEEAGERVTATSYISPFSQNVDANADLAGGNILGRWTRTLASGGDLQVQAYYDRTSRYESNFAKRRNTFDVDFLHRLPAARRHQILWGLGARFSLGDAPTVVSGLTVDPQKRTDRLITGFLQDEISLVAQRLSLTLGSKVLNTNFTDLEFQPSDRLTWTPSARQTIWLSFTHAVRTPSSAEEGFNLSGYIRTTPSGLPFFARFEAKKDFAPEQLNGYEASYRRLLRKNVYLDVAGCYNRYHDLFSEEIIGSPFLETSPSPAHLLLPAQFRNALFGTTTGVELAPEWRPTGFWRLRGSYSYLHMDLKRAPGSQDIGTAPNIEGSTPQHQVLAESGFDLGKKLQLDLDHRFVSALPGMSIPSYCTGDTRLAYRLMRRLEVADVGQNLFQPWHLEFAGDPGPLVGIKRSAYLKLTWMR
jgi:iron complex outermembrane recepter protein